MAVVRQSCCSVALWTPGSFRKMRPFDSVLTCCFSQPPKNLVAKTAEVAFQVICSSVAPVAEC